MSNSSKIDWEKRKRNAEIEHLLETAKDRSPASLASEVESILRILLARGVKWEIHAAFKTIFRRPSARKAPPYAHTAAEVALKRLLNAEESGIRQRLAEELLDRVLTDSGFTSVLKDFTPPDTIDTHPFVCLLLFLAKHLGHYTSEQLQDAAQQIEFCSAAVARVLLLHGRGRSVGAALVLATLSSGGVQNTLLSLLRETFQHGEAQIRDAILEGIANVLPDTIGFLTHSAVETLCRWGRSLEAADSPVDSLLREALTSIACAERTVRGA